MAASTPVLMIIFAFAFVPLVLAEVARKKSLPTIESFFLQDRKMPLVMLFFTVYATWVSSFAFLGSSASFYSQGPLYLTAFAWNALFGVLFYVLGKRIWFYGKRFGYVTAADFFEDVYGSRVLCLIVTITMLVFTLPYLQIQLASGAYLIEVATGGIIPWRVSGLLFYLIIIIYLWAGGMRAVALTDIFYGVLIFISMLGIGFFLVWQAGGIEYVFQTIREMDQSNVMLAKEEDASRITSWLSMFLVVPIGAIMGPPLWLRVYAAENKKLFHIMPFLLTFASIMYLGSILSGSAGILLEPDLQQQDTLIPTLLVRYSHDILSAALFCGIASAALSTANSQIHAIAAIYSVDIHKRYLNPKISEKNLVNIAKWTVLYISALAYLLMLQSPNDLIIETGTIALGGTAQIVVPVLGALFWKRSNKNAATFGLAAGLLILIVLRISTDISASSCGALALLMNGSIFMIGSSLLKTDRLSREKIVLYKELYSKECR